MRTNDAAERLVLAYLQGHCSLNICTRRLQVLENIILHILICALGLTLLVMLRRGRVPSFHLPQS